MTMDQNTNENNLNDVQNTEGQIQTSNMTDSQSLQPVSLSTEEAPSPSDVASFQHPLVFQCSSCRRILGDSYSLTNVSPPFLLLQRLHNCTISNQLELSEADDSIGATFVRVNCECGLEVALFYKSTPIHMDAFRNHFALKHQLVCHYQLNTAPLIAANSSSVQLLTDSMNQIMFAWIANVEKVNELQQQCNEMKKQIQVLTQPRHQQQQQQQQEQQQQQQQQESIQSKDTSVVCALQHRLDEMENQMLHVLQLIKTQQEHIQQKQQLNTHNTFIANGNVSANANTLSTQQHNYKEENNNSANKIKILTPHSIKRKSTNANANAITNATITTHTTTKANHPTHTQQPHLKRNRI